MSEGWFDLSGAIRVVKGDYFLNNFLRMHGEDVVLYGEGHNEIIFLRQPYTLTNKATVGKGKS